MDAGRAQPMVVRKLGRRYVRTVLWLQMQGAHIVVVAGGAGLLQLFIGADRA
jgi:hypothetical protein